MAARPPAAAVARVEQLRELIDYHTEKYFVFDEPEVSDAEFDALKAHYDDAQILEVLQLCGFYRMVAYLANGLALPLEAGAARFRPSR